MNTSASTMTASPMTRLAAKRPPSTLGTTWSITMRGNDRRFSPAAFPAVQLDWHAALRGQICGLPRRKVCDRGRDRPKGISAARDRRRPPEEADRAGAASACSCCKIGINDYHDWRARIADIRASDRRSTVIGCSWIGKPAHLTGDPACWPIAPSARSPRESQPQDRACMPLVPRRGRQASAAAIHVVVAANSKPIGTISPLPVAAARRNMCR